MTSWASSRGIATGLYLLAFGLALPAITLAETGVVSAVGTGREASDAILNLLRSVVGKYFNEDPPALTKGVLQNEILPNASSFVQSYKVIEGGGKGSVSLSANVDLDVVRALLNFTAAGMGETEAVRAVVVVRGARLPDGTSKPGTPVPNPYVVLEAAAKDRFLRRSFEVVTVKPEEIQSVGAGDEITAELLRGLGAKSKARVAFGLSSRYEAYENENSHNKEQRIVLTGTLLDVKTGAVLGKSSVNVTEPKGRKDQYAADLQRSLAEEGKDLFHEIMVSAGRRVAKATGQEDFSVVRVQYPSNPGLVNKFRLLLETSKSLKSVVEYSVVRGAFDLAVRPAMKDAALAKLVKGLASDEISVTILENFGQEGDTKKPALLVKVAPKDPAKTESSGGRVDEP